MRCIASVFINNAVPNPNEYWSACTEVTVNTLGQCVISYGTYLDMHHLHCEIACAHVWPTHIVRHSMYNMYWVATPLACVYIMIVWIVLCSAAGIKKYIVGLVIKLSSDPESAEVNSSIIFDSVMPTIYAVLLKISYSTPFTELWKIVSSKGRHMFML